MFKKGSLSHTFAKTSGIAATGLFIVGYTALVAGEFFINGSFDMDFAVAAGKLWTGVSLTFGGFIGGLFVRHHHLSNKERNDLIKATFD